MMSLWPFFAVTAVYHAITSHSEKQPPPGQIVDVDGRKLHLWLVCSHSHLPIVSIKAKYFFQPTMTNY